jgi:hypothetical protein
MLTEKIENGFSDRKAAQSGLLDFPPQGKVQRLLPLNISLSASDI